MFKRLLHVRMLLTKTNRSIRENIVKNQNMSLQFKDAIYVTSTLNRSDIKTTLTHNEINYIRQYEHLSVIIYL